MPSPTLVDSHCHLDDFPDLPAVLARAHTAGIGTLLAIGIGNGPADMHRALDIAEAIANAQLEAHPSSATAPAIFASAGIHPQEAHQATPEAIAKLRTLAAHPLCVAIGEIGLDFYHASNPLPPIQHAALIAQLGIAAEAGKPITIHLRTSELARPDAKAKFGEADAWADLFTLLDEHWLPTPQGKLRPGILHCFSGNAEQAQSALARGFHLSFAGNLTYLKSTAIQQAATACLADRILLETDAPFLSPNPLRGQTNEPANITHTAAFLAQLRNTTPQAIAELTTRNFHTLFTTTA